jgi:hypothetical protein
MDGMLFIAGDLYTEILKFYHSGFFLTIKIILGIYTLVLFIDIILLLIQRGVAGNIREGIYGMDVPRAILDKKEKTREDWEGIKKKLASANPVDYKVALIEADDFIGEIVKGLGYAGDNFGERLDNIPEDHVMNVAGMRQAHQVRNKIIHDDNFVLSQNDALGVLSQYEEFLRGFQVID